MRLSVIVAIAGVMTISVAPISAASPVRWTPDLIHSRAEFTVSHLIVSKVWGHIPITAMTFVTGHGSVIPEKIDVTLDVAHEDTDNHLRDADIRSAAYFDIAKYPTVAFHSTHIDASGTDGFTVTGDLTIKDKTRPVSFPVHVEGRIPDAGGTRVGYSGQLHIDRRDFGINDATLTPAGIPLVGNDVAIGLTVEATTTDASIPPK
jgi:polyisoprenoid-binding protein YceI